MATATRLTFPKERSLIAATIGHDDTDTSQEVAIGDLERRTGLYILGVSGTGKTTLIEHLIQQDVKNGHGLFFLDPHGDAIDHLLRLGVFRDRADQTFVLDPTDQTHSFGINLFACKDTTSLAALDETYTRVFTIFSKLFEKEWGTWLELILQQTLHVFIEIQGYTLSEVPLFLTDETFRNFLLAQVRNNSDVIHFWQKEFATRKRSDQDDMVQPLLTRIRRLLSHSYVKHVVSQPRTSISLASIMEHHGIVLVKLPITLAPDTKWFLGTILISELVHAAMRRPAGNRSQFSVFVDEFQNFANTDDFAVLFTQARKFGVATTIVHNERYGQLEENKKLAGATSAVPNKVFFQLTVEDAENRALEFMKQPPTVLKQEPQLVISEEPFSGLLSAHPNPEVNRFVRRYLKPLNERLEDIRVEMEGARLARMDSLDEAALHRLDAQMIAPVHIERYYVLQKAEKGVLDARQITEELKDLWERSRVTRLTIRYLNKVFTAIMEGSLKPELGDEEFSEFLIECTRHSSRVPWPYVPLLKLYISLTYGSPLIPRTIPFALAQAYGFFAGKVTSLIRDAEEKTRQKREEYRRRWLVKIAKDAKSYAEHEASEQKRERQKKAAKVEEWIFHGGDFDKSKECWNVPRVYTQYAWLKSHTGISELLSPYKTAEFTRGSARHYHLRYSTGTSQLEERLSEITEALSNDSDKVVVGWFDGGKYTYSDRKYPVYAKYCQFLRPDMVRELKAFLRSYGEGAFIILALLQASDGVLRCGSGMYSNVCTLQLPGIVGKEPIEVLRLVKKINDLKRSALLDYDKFMDTFLSLFSWIKFQSRTIGDHIASFFNHNSPYPSSRQDYLAKLQSDGGFNLDVQEFRIDALVKKYDGEERDDVISLRGALNERRAWLVQHHPTAASRWECCGELERLYLLARVCDLDTYGECVADLTFPQPTFSGAAEVVAGLRSLIEETAAQRFRAKEEKEVETYRICGSKRRDEEIGKISYHPPDFLEPQVLNANVVEEIKSACLREFSRAVGTWDAQSTLQVLDEFVQFCRLLSKPENHVRTLSMVYVTKPVNERQYLDMKAEMAWEFPRLPRFTAYAKVIEETGGGQAVTIRKIRTQKPLHFSERKMVEHNAMMMERDIITRTHALVCKERVCIEEELLHRQERWRTAAAQGLLPVVAKDMAKRKGHPKPRHSRYYDPPPTSE